MRPSPHEDFSVRKNGALRCPDFPPPAEAGSDRIPLLAGQRYEIRRKIRTNFKFGRKIATFVCKTGVMKNIRIVYMGTPEFAVYPLQLLVEKGYNVVGVVTMPDKKAGRGQKLFQSPVKTYAAAHGLPVLQPEKLKDETFLQELKALNPQLGIVVAFRMLPEAVWSMPPMGTFNLHASLLPDYRGAAPINWCLMNGDNTTGVTTFLLDQQIDTGDIILQREIAIAPEDNAGTLHDKLMYAGGTLVLDSIRALAEKNVRPLRQTEMASGLMRPAPKIFKEDGRIDWNGRMTDIRNKVRGLSPYPAAWTDFGGAYGEGISMKIFTVGTEAADHGLACGTVVCDGRKTLKIACQDGFVHLLDVQLAGKKRMDVKALLNGVRLFDPK